jgi:hypothetical protein
MKTTLATAAAILCTALPSMGLIKFESKSTLNNDGSAKFSAVVEIDLTAALGAMGMAGARNPLGDGRKELVQMIKGMSGNVDVWSDARAESTKGGATRISMSGFTKDWRAVGDIKKAIVASGQAGAIPVDEIPDIKLLDMKNDSSGNTVITMAGLDDLGRILDAARRIAVKKGEGPKPGQLSADEAEIANGLEQVRNQWPGLKAMVGPHVKGFSFKSEVEVSGTITSSDVFKQTGENTAAFTFTGDQLLSLADQIVADEQLPGKIVALVKEVETNFENEKSTAAVKSFIEPYLKTVYGGSANPRIVVKPGPNAFDYAAETAKAKAAQSAELKALLDEAGKSGKVKLPDALPK